MFRNIRPVIPSENSCAKIMEVHEDKIVEADFNKSLPSSNDYSLADLVAAGVKVAPVDPTIVHDSDSTSALAKDFVDNYVESANVEPSNSDEK